MDNATPSCSLLAEPTFQLSTHRIEALCDGVFSIVMTLLVLEIHVPNLEQATEAGLWTALVHLWPAFFGYIGSFIMLGVFWITHHMQFRTIKRVDRILLWINMLFLVCIGFAPFSTALLSRYPGSHIAIMTYGVNLIAMNAVLALHWWYATAGHRLIDQGVEPRLIKSMLQLIILGLAIYLGATLLSVINPLISVLLYILATVIYVIPRGISLTSIRIEDALPAEIP